MHEKRQSALAPGTLLSITISIYQNVDASLTMSMNLLFLIENEYATLQFLGQFKLVIFRTRLSLSQDELAIP